MFGHTAAACDSAPVSLSGVCFKTKMCKFFAAGKCQRLSDCKFAHSEEELRPLPDFTRTRICPFLREYGQCNQGPCCSYAHSPEELRARTPDQAQLLEDFRSLLAAKAACTEVRAAAAMEPQCQWTQPPPPPQPRWFQGQQQQQQQQQPQWQPAPQSQQSQQQQQQWVVFVMPCQAPPVPEPPIVAPDCKRAEPASKCCKAMDEDLDEDLDLSPGSWSRQSTQEPQDGPLEEFDGKDEEWEVETNWSTEEGLTGDASSASVFSEEKSVDTVTVMSGEPPKEVGEVPALLNLASACGLSFAVKNSFLAFEDSDDEDFAVRRVQSTGDLPTASAL